MIPRYSNVFRKWLRLQYRLNRRYLSLSFIYRFWDCSTAWTVDICRCLLLIDFMELFLDICSYSYPYIQQSRSHQPVLSYMGYRYLPSYVIQIALHSVIWGEDGQLWTRIRIDVRRWKYILNLRRVWMKFCPMWNLTVCTSTRIKNNEMVGCVPQVGVCKLNSNKWKPIFVRKQCFHPPVVGDILPENMGSYTRRSRSFTAVKKSKLVRLGMITWRFLEATR
jgi:hypothetical protein